MQVEAPLPSTPSSTTPDEHRREHTRLGTMWQELADRAGAVPGVEAAAVGTLSPLVGRDRGARLAIAGEVPGPEREFGVRVNQISPGFFATAGIRLLSGRAFTTDDRAASLRVAILNATAARAYFASESPLGRKISFPGQRIEDQYEIIGVVADARYRDLRTPDGRMVYLPITQAIDRVTSLMLAVRGRDDAAGLTATVRRTAETVIPGAYVSRVGTIEQRINASLVRERILSMLATFFAGLALALACIGLYGVMAYGVARRTREIGVRLAIGARPPAVIWMVVREMLVLVAAGAALGTAGAAVASRHIRSQLFGVSPGDAIATLVAVLVLVAATLAAAYLPARRASRIDPVVALRHD
jgi:predicted permease